MKFEKSTGQKIKDSSYVKFKPMLGGKADIKYVQNKTNGFLDIIKLSQIYYMLKSTGEIFEYKINENRAQNMISLKDSFKNIRDLINNNFCGAQNEIHLTLTYAENMTDTKRLYSDFLLFWKRYKYKYGEDFDYMSVVEPQGRGAWHCHVLIRHNDGKKVFIPSKELEIMWGNGFIKVKALEGNDNIGAYLSAYLGDIELNNETLHELGAEEINKLGIKEVKKDGLSKAYIKGGRLHLYPPGMNLFRHSKGIVFPIEEEMTYEKAKRKVGNMSPNFSSTVKIIDNENDDKVLNIVTYEHYNLNRK